MVEDRAMQEDDEIPEIGAPEPQESSPVDSVKEKARTLLENTPTDFGAWTLLLSEIEKTSPNDIQRICLVYDAFLSEFPLCYGYWKKYASHKARLCTLYEVEELYERALRVATYSVDLWVSYCTFAVLLYEDPADIRRLFERGLSFVGKDYLCHLLWDKYIEFEYSQKQWSRLAHIYINTLRYPIKKLHGYYESFKKLVATWEKEIECQKDTEMSSEVVSNCGTENVKDCGYAEISNVIRDILDQQDGLPKPYAVKKYLNIGELFYQRSNQLDRKISYFEARIRRPYFHVKPLDDDQLENWHLYVDFVEMQGDFDWTVKLYERCLIPCANYSEFWIRYVEFVDAKGGREIAKYALDRALTVFLKRVPAFRLYCAMFKEQIGDVCGSRALFHQSIMDSDPEFIENINREANMEKRMGNIDAACMIYEKAIEMAKEKHVLQILPVLYTNFAQFTILARGSIDAAREVFVKGIQQMPTKSIIEGLIRFITVHGGAEQIPKLDSIVANAIAPESDVSKAFSSQDREDISKLFLEFVGLYGTIHDIRMAWSRHRKLFPHIMRPSFNYTVPEKNILDKSKEGRNQMLVSPCRDVCGDIHHGGSDMHLTDGPQLKDSTGFVCEGVSINKWLPEENKNGTREREEQVELAEVKKQSIPEGTELHVEVECPNVAENPGVLSEPSDIGNHIKVLPDHESSDDLGPPALDNLSINSPDTDTQQSNPITSNDDCVHQELSSALDGKGEQNEHIHQESTAVLDGNKEQDGGNADEVLAIDEPDLQDIKSNSPSRACLQNDDSSLHLVSDLDPSELEMNSQIQMQAQSQTNSYQDSPASGAIPQNSSSAGRHFHLSYGRHASEDSSTSSRGYVQVSQSQQWQVHAQLQYPPASNSQMVITHGYPFQPQVLSNAPDQQVNQTQGQYQMAAAQAYPTANLAWPGQNIQQQGFVYIQPQLSTHTTQPPSEVYQQSVQANEQYRYSQSYQGFAPHIWQYYQQHLYYLQQQQQQIQNHLQQQQLQQKHYQQQHPENQQVLVQVQQQSNNQQESQQHLSPEQNQNLELRQQQQASQFQQQNLQTHATQQQQQQLLYIQQQQHLYLQQQQQLYLQQQLLQQQLLQQQQQQQYPQQAQQIITQQQQQPQQLLQQQQQQQQQQQPQLLQQQQPPPQQPQQQQQQPDLLQQEQQQQQQPHLLLQQQQQQQQPHLLQLQQQQELLQQQQQQQLLLLQQQQQLYQLQLQRQQQQQQISASELEALNFSYILQTVPMHHGNNQQRQDLVQEAETSQGEGANLQTAEHSGSLPSTPQKGATK